MVDLFTIKRVKPKQRLGEVPSPELDYEIGLTYMHRRRVAETNRIATAVNALSDRLRGKVFLPSNEICPIHDTHYAITITDGEAHETSCPTLTLVQIYRINLHNKTLDKYEIWLEQWKEKHGIDFVRATERDSEDRS